LIGKLAQGFKQSVSPWLVIERRRELSTGSY